MSDNLPQIWYVGVGVGVYALVDGNSRGRQSGRVGSGGEFAHL